MHPPLTIVICATPRTGSTLLCALLASSGVAGRPESWFRAEDRGYWAAAWGLAPEAATASYVDAAIRAGQSANGVFGLRIQAVTLVPLLAELRALSGAPGTELQLLQQVFGPCRFVFCTRQDDVAQAVSRLKAEVSQIWHLDGTGPDQPQGRARYDAAHLDMFRAEAAEGNTLWESWFNAQGIRPARLEYAAFTEDPVAQVRALLREFELHPTPATVIAAPNRRMADDESAMWATRYRAERGLPPA